MNNARLRDLIREDAGGAAVYGLISTPLWLLLGIYLLNRHNHGWRVLGSLIFVTSAVFVLGSVIGVIEALQVWRQRQRHPTHKLALLAVPFLVASVIDLLAGVALLGSLQYPTYFSPLPSNPTSIRALPSTTTTTRTYVNPRTYYRSGPTAQCFDGTYSYSANRRGTCSWHGGVYRWFY